MAAWPGTVPNEPLAGSFTCADQDNRLTFQPDAGDAIRRRRTTSKALAVSFELVLTAVQLAALRSFYDSDLEGGVLGFDFTDPILASTKTYSFAEPFQIRDAVSAGLYRVGISLVRQAE